MGWRLTGRMLRKSRSSVVVGITVGTILLTPFLLNHQQAMGAWGPCTVDQTPQYLNTITCTNGVCTGMVQITPQQSSCKNTDETACTDLPNDLYITYQPMAVEQGWTVFVGCLGATGLCAICVALAALVCLSPPWWQCVIGAGGCAISCATYTPDPCCWTVCQQDLTTRFAVPGGNQC